MDNIKKSKEIDILALVAKVWEKKKTLYAFVAGFVCLGLVVALTQQKLYTANVVLAPEATSMGMSQNLSDIASMIGIGSGGGGNNIDAIYPDIYPEIFASSDFIVKLFDIPVNVKGVTKTYYRHIKEDTRTPILSYPKLWISKLFAKKENIKQSKAVNPYRLTKEQDGICGAIRKSIGCQLNKGTSLIDIYVTDTDPEIAACMADTLKSRLQEYITLYRTQKARQDYDNAKKINAEAKIIYERARQKYASYSDANKDVQLASFQSIIEELENDMQLKFNNYTETAQQMRKAEEKIQENTPAFTELQSATVPLRASSTPRSIIVIMFAIAGVFADVVWVLFLQKLFFKK